MPIPVGVGFAYLSYQQYNHVVERESDLIRTAKSPEDIAAKDWQVSSNVIENLSSLVLLLEGKKNRNNHLVVVRFENI